MISDSCLVGTPGVRVRDVVKGLSGFAHLAAVEVKEVQGRNGGTPPPVFSERVRK